MFFKHNKSKNNRADVPIGAGHSGEKEFDESSNRSSIRIISPHFEGFPYLVTRFAPAVYHISVLPDRPRDHLKDIAARQFHFNRFECCLVMGADAGVYYHPDGEIVESATIPAGGTLVTGSLKLCCDISGDLEVTHRQFQLRRYIESRQQARILMGDMRKGGHPASKLELKRLKGLRKNGIPNGLEECPNCGEWGGECLDPNPRLKNLVVRVCCRCENVNRCAGCGELLTDRRVNANYYDLEDGQVWHVPGFTALNHKCTQGK